MSDREPGPVLAVDVILPVGLWSRVLMVQRKYPPFGLALPGGHVDAGEHPQDAAARELREETGVVVLPYDLQFLGLYGDPGRDPRKHVVSLVYVAPIQRSTTVAVAGDDAAAVTDIETIKAMLTKAKVEFNECAVMHRDDPKRKAKAIRCERDHHVFLFDRTTGSLVDIEAYEY